MFMGIDLFLAAFIWVTIMDEYGGRFYPFAKEAYKAEFLLCPSLRLERAFRLPL